jgi:hypothetical protein
MLELGLPRALVISTVTLAATFACGAARADVPPPAAPPPAAAPAAPSPPPNDPPLAAPIPAKRPAKPGHVYTPPGYPEPPEEPAPAEEAAPPPRPAPRLRGGASGFELGYGAPRPSYGMPVSQVILPEQMPTYPAETQMRSAGLVAGGVVLLSLGMVGLIAGSAMVGAHEPTSIQSNSCFDCSFDGSGTVTTPPVILKPGFQSAGIGTLIGSVVAIGASIPLIVIGAKKVPYVDSASPAARAAKRTPSIGVGPGSATLVWQF